MEDIDLNLEDFIARVNSDMVGKFVNIASRSAGFIRQHFAGQLCTCDESSPAIQAIRERRGLIAEHYEARDFGKAIREIMALTDLANQYVDSVKPWELARQPERTGELQLACTNALNLFRLFAILLKPVLPALSARAEAFLNVAPLAWDDSATVLAAGHAINAYRHLMTRVDRKLVTALVEANRKSLVAVPQARPQKPAEPPEMILGTSGADSGTSNLAWTLLMKLGLRLTERWKRPPTAPPYFLMPALLAGTAMGRWTANPSWWEFVWINNNTENYFLSLVRSEGKNACLNLWPSFLSFEQSTQGTQGRHWGCLTSSTRQWILGTLSSSEVLSNLGDDSLRYLRFNAATLPPAVRIALLDQLPDDAPEAYVEHLYWAARQAGRTPEELAPIIHWPRKDKIWEAIVRHARNHKGHMHVRLLCGRDEPRYTPRRADTLERRGWIEPRPSGKESREGARARREAWVLSLRGADRGPGADDPGDDEP